MNPVILFRPDRNTEEEMSIACKYFDVYTNRAAIPDGSLIIPRYSALPYYNELDRDMTDLGSKLVNTTEQFNYIANFEYYEDIKDFTFKTYFDSKDLPDHTSFVIKGKTNSKKHEWNTKMFAINRIKAREIAFELQKDGLIGYQDIIYREYVPLMTYEYLINDLPVTNEYRFFTHHGEILSHGYYWSCAEDINKTISQEGIDLVKKVAKIIKYANNFTVIDVAQKATGEWIIVELNAGEMSGLSLNDPDELYKNLRAHYE
jgi:hypothetical protein